MCGHAQLDIIGNSHDEVVHLDASIEGRLVSIRRTFSVAPSAPVKRVESKSDCDWKATNQSTSARIRLLMCDLYVCRGASRH
jgi:hypothetical protein